MSVPRPEPLSGEVMLPFALWPVADLVDGRRSVNVIAEELGVTVSAALNALHSAEAELGVPLTESAPPSGPAAPSAPAPVVYGAAALLETLTLITVDLIGPMGEVIVEDAFDDVGEQGSGAELVSRIAQDLREPQRGAFLGRVRAKGLS